MDYVGAFIILIKVHLVLSTNCFEEMKYHKKYAYGYDIICTKLSPSNIDELQKISAYNEIKLTVTHSDLKNSTLFRNIPKLRVLEISNSNIELDVKTANEFSILKKLEVLNITGSNLSFIPKKVFEGLDKLRVLNLRNNNLETLQDLSLDNLEVLDIGKNLFTNSSSIPLCKLPSLVRLLGQQNLLTEFSPQKNCAKLLRFLDLSKNQIFRLDGMSRLDQLEEISLSYNKLDSLSNKFDNLTNLRLLNLEGNRITIIKSNEIYDLVNLTKLNLKNNLIHHIDPNSFQKLDKLEELYLDNNNLTEIGFKNLNSLKELTLSGNFLNIKEETFQNLPQLLYLSLRNCHLKKVTFHHLDKLQIIDLSENELVIEQTTFAGLSGLIIMELKNNSLLELPDFVFQKSTKLRILDLSSNSIYKVNQNTFRYLNELEVLNLSFNHLKSFGQNVLMSMPKLKSIDLEGNRLKFIEYSVIFEMSPFLKMINIEKNELPCEFLSDMFTYFKNRNMSFTTNKKLSVEKENVGGISCHEDDNDDQRSNEIVEPVKVETYGFGKRVNISIVIVILVVVLLLSVSVMLSYNIYVLIQRRRNSGDEIELLDRTSCKVEYYST